MSTSHRIRMYSRHGNAIPMMCAHTLRLGEYHVRSICTHAETLKDSGGSAVTAVQNCIVTLTELMELSIQYLLDLGMSDSCSHVTHSMSVKS